LVTKEEKEQFPDNKYFAIFYKITQPEPLITTKRDKEFVIDDKRVPLAFNPPLKILSST